MRTTGLGECAALLLLQFAQSVHHVLSAVHHRYGTDGTKKKKKNEIVILSLTSTTTTNVYSLEKINQPGNLMVDTS